MQQIVTVQEAWRPSVDGVGRLEPIVSRALETHSDPSTLILLPQGEAVTPITTFADLEPLLGQLAKTHSVYLAGSVPVQPDGDNPPSILGFLFDPSGKLLLRVNKSLPDLVVGFSDLSADLYNEREFKVAETKHSKIGMVLGEDILSPQIVRGTALAGAEVILNPCLEFADHNLDARHMARTSRAYENMCYVVSASPMSRSNGTHAESLPVATAVHQPDGDVRPAPVGSSLFRASLDVDKVRRVRQGFFANFLAVHRTSLYAKEYSQTARVSSTTPPHSRESWIAESQKRAAQARSDLPEEPVYDVALVQTALRNVPDADHRDEVMALNLKDSMNVATVGAWSPKTRLVVFPEFWLQGFVPARSLEEWLKVAVEIPGPATEKLSEFAQQFKVYVAGAIFEVDKKFPDRWFNTAFIMNDSGDIIHRYRKIQCADISGLMPNTTPGNLLSDYLDTYGLDGLFPVVDTPIGRLGTMICFDINFPETARALAHRGADVIVHPTAEPHNTRRRGWEKTRRTRAFENMVYLASAGHGCEYRNYDDQKVEFYHRGHSELVNFDGTIGAIADGPGEICLSASIDLKSLYDARNSGQDNLLLWDETSTYASLYNQHQGFPEDRWLKEPMRTAQEGPQAVIEVIKRYNENGVFVMPIN